MRNIDKIQKHPDLNRCGKAFSQIKKSVKLLKDNFNGYYREFVGSKNSTIMMEHFILDVSKSTNSDPVLMSQFKKIIMFYRKIARDGQANNPKAKMFFDKVDESLKNLEKQTQNIRTAEQGDGCEGLNIECDETVDDDSVPIIMSATPMSVYDVTWDGNRIGTMVTSDGDIPEDSGPLEYTLKNTPKRTKNNTNDHNDLGIDDLNNTNDQNTNDQNTNDLI